MSGHVRVFGCRLEFGTLGMVVRMLAGASVGAGVSVPTTDSGSVCAYVSNRNVLKCMCALLLSVQSPLCPAGVRRGRVRGGC